MTHVKSEWKAKGGVLLGFDKEVLAKVLKGVDRLRPSLADDRGAFILPHCVHPLIFVSP